jgi:hypothetical protein
MGFEYSSFSEQNDSEFSSRFLLSWDFRYWRAKNNYPATLKLRFSQLSQ